MGIYWLMVLMLGNVKIEVSVSQRLWWSKAGCWWFLDTWLFCRIALHMVTSFSSAFYWLQVSAPSYSFLLLNFFCLQKTVVIWIKTHPVSVDHILTKITSSKFYIQSIQECIKNMFFSGVHNPIYHSCLPPKGEIIGVHLPCIPFTLASTSRNGVSKPPIL